MNDDGLGDVIVGAPTADPGGVNSSGEVVVFLGPDLTVGVTYTEPSPEIDAWFGYAVAAGDINQDGRDELIVGARYADPGGVIDAGEVFVMQY